jgi:hypothetical protein
MSAIQVAWAMTDAGIGQIAAMAASKTFPKG